MNGIQTSRAAQAVSRVAFSGLQFHVRAPILDGGADRLDQGKRQEFGYILSPPIFSFLLNAFRLSSLSCPELC